MLCIGGKSMLQRPGHDVRQAVMAIESQRSPAHVEKVQEVQARRPGETLQLWRALRRGADLQGVRCCAQGAPARVREPTIASNVHACKPEKSM